MISLELARREVTGAGNGLGLAPESPLAMKDVIPRVRVGLFRAGMPMPLDLPLSTHRIDARTSRATGRERVWPRG